MITVRVEPNAMGLEEAGDVILCTDSVSRLPPDPPRDLSRVAVRTCPISGLESHR